MSALIALLIFIIIVAIVIALLMMLLDYAASLFPGAPAQLWKLAKLLLVVIAVLLILQRALPMLGLG